MKRRFIQIYCIISAALVFATSILIPKASSLLRTIIDYHLSYSAEEPNYSLDQIRQYSQNRKECIKCFTKIVVSYINAIGAFWAKSKLLDSKENNFENSDIDTSLKLESKSFKMIFSFKKNSQTKKRKKKK